MIGWFVAALFPRTLLHVASRSFRNSFLPALAILFLPSLALADLPRLLNLQASQGTNAPGTNTITISYYVERPLFGPQDVTGDRVLIYPNANCEGSTLNPYSSLDGFGAHSTEINDVSLPSGQMHTFSARYADYIGNITYGPCVGPVVGHALVPAATIGQDFDVTPRDRIRINYRSGFPSALSPASISQLRLYRSLSPSLACDPNTLVLATGPTSGLQQFADPGVSEIGRDIYYFSQQVGVNGITGHCSAPLTAWIPPEAPASFQASDNENPLAINLQWSAVPGAVAYNLYRLSDTPFPHYDFWGTVTGLSHTDYDFHNPFEDVIYAVRPTGINGREGPSTSYGRVGQASDSGYRAYSAPGNVAASDWSGYKVDVAWDTPQPAPEPGWVRPPGVLYRVFRSTSDQRCQGSPIGVSYSSNQYEDRTAVPGTPYFYSVQGSFEDSDSRTIRNGQCSATAVGLRALLYANGRVVTQSGAGLGGVFVQASSGNSAVTNSDGYFSIAGLNGYYYINATLSGYSISPSFSNPVAVTHTSVDGLTFQAFPTATPTSSPTVSPTSTSTATPTATYTYTATSTPTPTSTRTSTPTSSPTPTFTRTPTSTFTSTPTATWTSTPSGTPSITPTATYTQTATPTSTGTPTVPATPSSTPVEPPATPRPTPNQPPGGSASPIFPIGECIQQDATTQWVGTFGYRNESADSVELSLRDENRLIPEDPSIRLPFAFLPGGQSKVLSVPLRGGSVTWRVAGHEATLDLSSPHCCDTPDCNGCFEVSLEQVHSTVRLSLQGVSGAINGFVMKVSRLSKDRKARAIGKSMKKMYSRSAAKIDQSLQSLPLAVRICATGCEPSFPADILTALRAEIGAIDSGASGLARRVKKLGNAKISRAFKKVQRNLRTLLAPADSEIEARASESAVCS